MVLSVTQYSNISNILSDNGSWSYELNVPFTDRILFLKINNENEKYTHFFSADETV